MIKRIGYLIFAFFYYVARLFPKDAKKIFLVATHDDSPEGNIGIVADAIKGKGGYRCVWFTRRDKITNPFNFFLKKAYHLATSSYIFLDNEFLPMAFIRFPEDVKVVQLWHGTGTIKKFGQDVNTGTLKKLEYRANRNITHLIVNSEETKKEYASAFGVESDRIYVLGLPRTDYMLDEEFLQERRESFFRKYGELRGKRCILYAPTFRDQEVACPQIHLNLSRMSRELAEDEVLLVRLHPFVAGHVAQVFEEEKWDNIYNLSGYSGVTTLLAVADVLITDYSSIVFEYCLRNKPMVFYAYDLDKFERDGRSFYRDYRKFVPGDVVRTQGELMESLKNTDVSVTRRFVRENFAYLDGNATKRLLELIFS